MAQAGPARTQFRPTKKQLQAKDSKRVRKAWSDPYVYPHNIVRDRRFRYRGNRKRNSAAPNNQVSQKRESRSHAARRYERRYTGGWSVFVVESDGQGRPAPEYAASPVLSVTWGDVHTRLRFPKNGAGDGGALTSHRIRVIRFALPTRNAERPMADHPLQAGENGALS